MEECILITAAKEDTELFFSDLSRRDCFLHVPLERYRPRRESEEITETLHHLEDFDQIIYGSKRNARFLMNQLKRVDKLDAARRRLNIAFDEATFNFLNDEQIAAIHPQNGSKAIDVLELLLRLKRLGPTLYPCGSERREDLPGLLQELDMPLKELPLFDLEGPSQRQLATYRDRLNEAEPTAVIFHSRRSITRTLTAFPDLAFDELQVIAADQGITEKLEDNNISVDEQADGSWASLAELL